MSYLTLSSASRILLKNDDNCDIFISQIHLIDDARIISSFDSDYLIFFLEFASLIGLLLYLIWNRLWPSIKALVV
jgi:hypothetical protein